MTSPRNDIDPVAEGVTAAIVAVWSYRLELALALPAVGIAWLFRDDVPGVQVAMAAFTLVAYLIVVRALWPRLHAARVRRQWARAMIDSGAADPPPKKSLKAWSRYGTKARRVTVTPAGDVLQVRVGRGSSLDAIDRRRAELAACLKVRDVRVTPGTHAAQAVVTLVRRDPFDDAAPMPWPNRDAEHLSLWDDLPFGRDENGHPLTLRLVEKNILLGGEPGAGKALALDTPVPTPAGWTTMGELQPGDQVFDERGQVCTVTYAWPVRHGRPCYELEFSDGTTVVADEDHQWITETAKQRLGAAVESTRSRQSVLPTGVLEHLGSARAESPTTTLPDLMSRVGASGSMAGIFYRVANGVASVEARTAPYNVPRGAGFATMTRPVRLFATDSLVDALLAHGARSRWDQRKPPRPVTTGHIAATLRRSDGGANHSIRLAAPLDLPPAELPIHPYTLGAWLGDGTSRAGQITCADDALIEILRLHGETVSRQAATVGRSCGVYRVHGLTTRLRALGLLQNKHIPLMYLRASEAQRRALLAGLLDTDGHCTPGGKVEFAITSKRLAHETRHLAASLGYKPTLTTRPCRGRNAETSTAYRVAFTPPDDVFWLPRKAARRATGVRASAHRRSVVAVRPVPSVPVRCIAVDSASHQFLIEHTCIPTHNSAALSLIAATAALDENARLWLLDGKQVELAAWAPCAQALVGPNTREAIALLQTLRATMEDRYTELLARGLRKIPREPDMPLHVLICDELALYLQEPDKEQRALFAELLRDLIARGRAAGVIVVAATQKPSVDIIPSSIRDLIALRLALRCSTPQSSDTVLGQGWATAGADASTVPIGQRGVGYLLAEGERPERLKTYYLDDETIGAIAARAAASDAITGFETLLASPSMPAVRETVPPGDVDFLRHLPQGGDGLTRQEWSELVGLPWKRWWGDVDALMERGTVVRAGRGVKGSPYRYRLAGSDSD
jgi:hypothetical protein